MRMQTGLVLGLLLTLAAGCGSPDNGDGVATVGGQATASSSPSAGPDADREAGLKFARCMRENGLPDFPDPELGAGGGTKLMLPEGVTPQQAEAATAKCKQYLPGGGQPPKMDPQQLENARQMAKCMRENGVPNFPDPSEDGGMRLDMGKLGMDPDDPRFKAAEQACAQFRPSGTSEKRING